MLIDLHTALHNNLDDLIVFSQMAENTCTDCMSYLTGLESTI